VITQGELRRLAAQNGVRVELQERGYVLGWFLLGLSQTVDLRRALVFKGGTALRKAYFSDYRFSEDLDFTVVEPVDEETLRAGIERVCRKVEQASGLRMHLALWKRTRDVPGEEAYQARVAYIGPLGRMASDPPRITLDLTRYERLVLSPVDRTIHHPYSDAPQEPALVPTYRLEEMLAEKLRAMLRRCYPRDLYDVWHLLAHRKEYLDRSLALSVLREKCRYKGYVFSSADDFLAPARREGMADAWTRSLQHLVSSLPSYETVVGDLPSLLSEWLEGRS